MDAQEFRTEFFEVNMRLIASGETTALILNQIGENSDAEAQLNQELLRARDSNQNPRALFLRAAALLEERASLFGNLVDELKIQADSSRRGKTLIETFTVGGAS